MIIFGSFLPSLLVGLHHQSLLGSGSRHCYGINYTNHWKKLPRPLRWICHRHSAAGESIGTGRPYLRWTLVGEHLSPTPQGTTSESAGVTRAPQRCLAVPTGRASRRGRG